MANKIKSIVPIVLYRQEEPNSLLKLSWFGLDKKGGLWKWDRSQQTDKWVEVCKPLKG